MDPSHELLQESIEGFVNLLQFCSQLKANAASFFENPVGDWSFIQDINPDLSPSILHFFNRFIDDSVTFRHVFFESLNIQEFKYHLPIFKKSWSNE